MIDILIVDDEQDLRELVSDLLEDHAFTVHAAGDGLEALTWLREQLKPPKLVLLDVMMPRMDGPTFRKELLLSPVWKDIPVVLMTASIEGENVVKELGVQHLLKKPLRFDGILWAVRQFIAKTSPPAEAIT